MNNLSRFCSFALGLILPIALTGCATFRVDSPNPSDPKATINGWSNQSGFIVIDVAFNSAVDPTTAIVTKTVILHTPKDPNAAGSFLPIDPTHYRFKSTLPWEALIGPQATMHFTLTLIGTDRGQGVIKSTAGKVLDGDYDGNPGGDYLIDFTQIN